VSSKLIVNCPTCSAPVSWDAEHRWRPFCSERCRLIDLGAWADESHRIADDRELSVDQADQDIEWLDLPRPDPAKKP
jgi:endogenous inhibitor of DNA gyrase (YacG/DUF329 family)